MQIEELRRDGLQCVGWYHSHPTFAVLPSTIDVYNQHAQQVGHAHNAGDVNATPYVAAIVGPYAPHAGGAQSQMSWFYVENRRPEQFSLGQAPEACLQHMVPKTLAVTLQEEAAVAVEEVLADAEPLLQRYCVHEHRTDFSEVRARSDAASQLRGDLELKRCRNRVHLSWLCGGFMATGALLAGVAARDDQAAENGEFGAV